MPTSKLELQAGDRLTPLTKSVTQEQIERFEAVSHALRSNTGVGSAPVNIHTDEKRAKEMGLEGPVASGQMSFAYLHELLARQFGVDFLQGGRLSVTFILPVYPGNVLTAHGVVQSRESVEHRTNLVIEVWLENQREEKTAVGTAKITIPSPLT